jgi:hypothetical protein
MAPPGTRDARGRIVLLVLAAALVYAVATPWILRPWFLSDDALPRSELTLGTMEDTDLFLNVWILAWIARAAVESPAEIFAGNIFHPAPNAIAGSENMLAHLPVTAPAYALSASALAVFKTMLVESFVLSGLAMWGFVFFHTRSFAAGLVAGALFTLAPWRVQNVPHPQYLGFQYFPLALLAVDLWLADRRVRFLVLLAAALALQALACLYLGYFTFLAVPVYAAVRLLSLRDGRARAVLALALAHLGGGVAAAPVALPYVLARAEGMIPEYEVGAWGDWSFRPWWYVGAPFLFRVGPVVLAVLALDLLVRGLRRLRRGAAANDRSAPAPSLATWPSERALWVTAAAAVVLSAGPSPTLPGGTSLPTPYGLLVEVVPGFAALRGPGRFFMVVAAAAAALAGFAFARWSAAAPRAARAAAAALLVAATAYAAAPHPAPTLEARLGERTPEVYRWLASRASGGAVLEMPAAATDHDAVGSLRNARYMLASTAHWRPLLNGYTGHNPAIARFYNAVTRRLPDPDAVRLLTEVVDVDWLILHRDELLDHERARWEDVSVPGLTRVARFGGDEVFAVSEPADPAWRARIAEQMSGADARTFDGIPTAPLAPECRAARILAVETPPVVAMVPVALPFRVVFENASPCPWPTLGVRPEGLVGLTYRWTDPAGEPYTYPPAPFSPLARPVAAGTTVDDTLVVVPPSGRDGPWRLDVRLVQWGDPTPLAEKTVTVAARGFAPRPEGGDPLFDTR